MLTLLVTVLIIASMALLVHIRKKYFPLEPFPDTALSFEKGDGVNPAKKT